MTALSAHKPKHLPWGGARILALHCSRGGWYALAEAMPKDAGAALAFTDERGIHWNRVAQLDQIDDWHRAIFESGETHYIYDAAFAVVQEID